jgi:16S rRNA (uracil1498-N3)-methyltransferase
MPRFYIEGPLAVNSTLELPAAVARHAVAVLRLREGEALTLFNGKGGEYRARLVTASGRQAVVHIEAFSAREAELPFAVTVVQALPSGDKMDWIVEKSVELGADALQPLAVHRSVVRLNAERALRRRDHWQAIAQAAAEQCGRNRIPSIHPVASLPEWLEGLPEATLRLVASPRARQPLAALARPPLGEHLQLVIGPEGGFTDEEEGQLDRAGFHGVSLGARVLRTETAALAALAMLNALWNPDPASPAGD